jgi:hypothetical protein
MGRNVFLINKINNIYFSCTVAARVYLTRHEHKYLRYLRLRQLKPGLVWTW